MMSMPESIKPRKLSDAVQDRLLDLIRRSGLRPGDALPSERELMAQYGVGRPAIREAMQGLQHMGIVDIRHGGRPRVASPSVDAMVDQLATSMRHLLTHGDRSLEHLKEARIALEVEMARVAATRRTADDIAELTAIIAAQTAAQPDPEAFLDHDAAFHRRIAAVSGNPIFEALSDGVFGWMRSFHVEQVRKLGLEALTLREHRNILDAISAGNPQAAAQSMRDHLERANALYHQENAT